MRQTHITVAIATLGRAAQIGDTLAQLRAQTRPPDQIIISATTPSDCPADEPRVLKIFGSKGLCAQRNRILEALPSRQGLLVFFDDDYLPSRFALERLDRFFAAFPAVVGANGHLIADGIGALGISTDDALAAIRAYDARLEEPEIVLQALRGLYGCNMAFRVEVIGETRFDERLPLYGWQEDVDFSARIGRRGVLVKTNAWAGVHRGVKAGRVSGVRFGYSQIANPLYLRRKGTLRTSEAFSLIAKNIIANHIRCAWPEPWVDRAGRVRGNWRALRDLAGGALRPEAILELT